MGSTIQREHANITTLSQQTHSKATSTSKQHHFEFIEQYTLLIHSRKTALLHNLTKLLRLLILLQHRLKREWLKRQSITQEMLTHRLNPMQPQTVQHSTRAFHNDQHCDGEEEPHEECNDQGNNADDSGGVQARGKGHGPEHEGELLVSQRQGPETEVRGGVGYAIKAEFYFPN